jgi:hypothetical protein
VSSSGVRNAFCDLSYCVNASRLWTEQDAKGQVTTHGYLNCGDEYTRLYADGTRLTFSYNSLRQIIGIANST